MDLFSPSNSMPVMPHLCCEVGGMSGAHAFHDDCPRWKCLPRLRMSLTLCTAWSIGFCLGHCHCACTALAPGAPQTPLFLRDYSGKSKQHILTTFLQCKEIVQSYFSFFFFLYIYNTVVIQREISFPL